LLHFTVVNVKYTQNVIIECVYTYRSSVSVSVPKISWQWMNVI